MKAAFLTGLRQLEVRETPAPRLKGPRDVLLRIGIVGVCGSDVHYYTTGRIGSLVVKYPDMTGHECAGTVVAVGSEVSSLKPGQRVAVDPLITCGQCDQCRAGRSHTCRNQAFLGCPGQAPGALAEYLVMPAESCYPIPDSMTLVQATLVEPLSIGVYAQRVANMPPGAKVAILGVGPIGLCVLLACRAASDCTTYVTDLIEERLALACQLGAHWTGNPARQDIVAAIEQLEPLGMDFVFECAGKQETLDQGVELLKPGGTLLIIGIPEVDRVSFLIHRMRRQELRVLNVRRQNECVAPAIDLLASGKINVDPLATHHFPLAETKTAFDLVAGYQDGVVKAIIHVPS
ncbi:MAG: alcohol dehydrogenase catalytic domain-containing protein [Acidobacteriia bacterium]|nr:alcohol dehydrogenase catalytic domain-containing protein [Terriglobia bacterium]